MMINEKESMHEGVQRGTVPPLVDFEADDARVSRRRVKSNFEVERDNVVTA